jgi:hypothetical protein
MVATPTLGRLGGDRARRILEHAARDRDPEIGLAPEEALAGWPDGPDQASGAGALHGKPRAAAVVEKIPLTCYALRG